jgi:hypothetical protein
VTGTISLYDAVPIKMPEMSEMLQNKMNIEVLRPMQRNGELKTQNWFKHSVDTGGELALCKTLIRLASARLIMGLSEKFRLDNI